LTLLYLCGLAAVFSGMLFLPSPGLGVLCGASFTILLYLAYGYDFRGRLGAEAEAVLLISLGFCLLMISGGLFDFMDWSFLGPGGDARSGFAVGGLAVSLMLAFLINKRTLRIPAAMALTTVIAMVAFVYMPFKIDTSLIIADDFLWLKVMALLSVAFLTLPFLLGNRPITPLARICVLNVAAISPYLILKTNGTIISVFLYLIALPVIYANAKQRWNRTIPPLMEFSEGYLSFPVFCRRVGVVIMASVMLLPCIKIMTAIIFHEGPTSIVANFVNDKSSLSESLFIKLAMKDIYLWHDKIRVTGISDADPDELLYKMRYKPQDKGYSFTSTIREDEAANKGMQYDRLGFSIKAIEKRLFIRYVYNKSSAWQAGLRRGFEIIELNHRSPEEIKRLKLIKEIVMDLEAGKPVHFRVKDLQDVLRDVWVKNETFEQDPPLDVIFEQEGRKIGYLLFWSFNSQQEKELSNIFSKFEKEGIEDLILDLRYNGGGQISIAQHLASRITGKATQGKLFMRCIHNDRYRDRDRNYFFVEADRGLNLKRLIVLTGENTASASELIINNLRPYIPVITIGETTAGKPVGQEGITYGNKMLYLVTFHSYNALNEGDYFHGIPSDYRVTDDLTKPLGSPEEGMTKAALEYLGRGIITLR
jgi:carboxyl-terminal processing protease